MLPESTRNTLRRTGTLTTTLWPRSSCKSPSTTYLRHRTMLNHPPPVLVVLDLPALSSTGKLKLEGYVVKISSQSHPRFTRSQLDFFDKEKAKHQGPSFSSAHPPH